jgi:hypothetical protein
MMMMIETTVLTYIYIPVQHWLPPKPCHQESGNSNATPTMPPHKSIVRNTTHLYLIFNFYTSKKRPSFSLSPLHISSAGRQPSRLTHSKTPQIFSHFLWVDYNMEKAN